LRDQAQLIGNRREPQPRIWAADIDSSSACDRANCAYLQQIHFPCRYFARPDALAACTSAPVKRSTFLSATNKLIALVNSC
jgi:hypothetical protein